MPRKKKAVAVKDISLYWLVLRNRQNGALLLHKRPAKGIWGGLWCVPCLDSLATLDNLVAELDLTCDDLHEGIEISHRLTHRQLHIVPFTAQTSFKTNLEVILPNAEWVLPQNLSDYGIPKPLKNYLDQVTNSLF